MISDYCYFTTSSTFNATGPLLDVKRAGDGKLARLRRPCRPTALTGVLNTLQLLLATGATSDQQDDLEAARALLANPDIGVTQIAHRLGVSPATLYRYLPAARTANTPTV